MRETGAQQSAGLRRAARAWRTRWTWAGGTGAALKPPRHDRSYCQYGVKP
jgi:hypothetical protein